MTIILYMLIALSSFPQKENFISGFILVEMQPFVMCCHKYVYLWFKIVACNVHVHMVHFTVTYATLGFLEKLIPWFPISSEEMPFLSLLL